MKMKPFMKTPCFSVAILSVMLASAAGSSGGRLAVDDSPKGLIESAEQGNADGQFHLGMWYESHHNYEEAAKWYRRAAGQRNVAAQYHFAVLCENGQGVPQDYLEAAKWYLQAAGRGNIPAKERLGTLYENGLGVPQDSIRAYAWFHIAAAQGDREAEKHAQALEKTLTREQLAQGQGLAREWRKQYPEMKIPY
jgi:TPR repeat protein